MMIFCCVFLLLYLFAPFCGLALYYLYLVY